MKLSDYVIGFLEKAGVKHVFYLPGGGAMHLDDSLGQSKEITPVCMLHEQAAAIAAEAYARVTNNCGVCLVTSGPGGTNTLTGLVGAFIDSTPVVFISGQAKRSDLVNGQGIRQFGIQEADMVSIVSPVTKYAVRVMDPEDIRFEMEKCFAVAKNGRPGPVWLELPLDIQASQVEPKNLRGYDGAGLKSFPCSENDIEKVIGMLNESKRPALLVGNGVRLSGAAQAVRRLYDILNIPVLTTWNGVDLIEEDHQLYYGRPGAVGHRHANLIQQNADLFITIGTRLNLLSTGYDFDGFLKNARHVMVDIDPNEMKKISVHPELAVNCDAADFIERLIAKKDEIEKKPRREWFAYCDGVKKKYPIRIKEQEPPCGFVNTYDLIDEISSQMKPDDIYQFTSSGTGADIAMQVFRIKRGQRAFLTKGLASMGFDLPASIGSCLASGKRTVCMTGDGGFMMNIQELETLRRLNLNVKIFILKNDGYSMIYGSQYRNFSGRLTGCTPESGLVIPDIAGIASAFGVKSYTIDSQKDLPGTVAEVLESKGPAVCCVKSCIEQKILPRQTNYMRSDGQMASRPLEDMSPLLDRDELKKDMIAENIGGPHDGNPA